MSHALRRLRAHFNDDLVVVMGSELQMTSLGLALRAPVRKVVREVENTLKLTITFDPLTTTETITIAASETAEGMLLAPVIRGLAEIAPQLVVSVTPLPKKAAAQSLDHGADLLLLPQEMAVDELETMPILADSVSCMVWERHCELQDSLEITAAQYRAARHIVANGERTDSFALDSFGVEMLRDRSVYVRTASLAMIPAIIVGSDLIATGSSWLFQNYAASMPLKVIPAPFARRQSLIVAQWPRHRQAPKVMWFLDQIKAYYGRYYTL
jgi:DNA-binding transcriptional LysR family regulator